ncbi:Cupin domain protein [Calidithermus terrae]|uniref:Cupin domain protein n=1 Tax=Calidithermus terrae TaxID=1408545 RepID=A0A399EGW0_9DEIN|nr:cupin domain-containing protein [Calidithermus terrae]RIH82813.1 Cupin domain protein [Calidithermus terrae]
MTAAPELRATFPARTDGKGSPTVLETGLAPHVHTGLDEAFISPQGTLEVRVGGEALFLQPGGWATAYAGAVHHFFNPTGGTVRSRVELEPGHRGFGQSLIVAYGLAGDGPTDAKSMPRNPLHLALLLERGACSFPGLMGLLPPAFRRPAADAQRRGVEQELLRKHGA